jgi:hypothetical protein
MTRPPKTFLGGRLRASTVFLLALFAGALALLIVVRP